MKLSEFIKNERKLQGLTQKELAKKLKISRVMLLNVENGNIKAGTKVLRAVAKYFKIDIIDVVVMNNETDK